MPWKTDHEPTAFDKLSPQQQEYFSKLSPQGKEAAEKIIAAGKKTQAQAAFQLILSMCWDGKDKKINKEQFFDITDSLFQFLWIAATMETARLVSEDGPGALAENLMMLQLSGNRQWQINAKQLATLTEMLK